MRVFFDYQAFTIQSYGGISRYVLELGSRLAIRRDVEVRLCAGWHRNLMLRDDAPAWAQGRYLHPWPKTGPLRHVLNRWMTRRHARRWKPQLVHETYFRTGRNYLPGVPMVLTVYDLTYFVLPIESAESRRTRCAQQAAIARADRIICISENTRNDLLRYFPVDPQRVSVIHLAGPSPKDPNEERQAHPGISGPYFLHVGLRHSYKNFDVVLQAIAGSPELKSAFRIVAFGGPPFSESETARMIELGLDPSHVLHRTGSDELLDSLYAHATAFVCPSLYEGFGLPPLEAMARGCPVICSDRGSLPEVVGDAALLFDPTKPADLTRALKEMAESSTLASEYRARGKRQAARFSWDRCVDETLVVYRSLLG